MISVVAEEKSHNCLEGDIYSATDNYFNLQNIYTLCLEGEIVSKKRTMVCGTCGTTFEDYPSQRHKFCSYVCYWNALAILKKGVKLTEDIRSKISEANRGENHPFYGKHFTEEHRRKISIANKGKHHSEETKQKISNALKGKTGLCGEKHPLYGKSPSEETRKKISKALKGRIPWHKGKTGVYSEVVRRRISEVQKGRPRTEETKRKISLNNWIKKHPGKDHPNWKGGISFEPYCTKFNDGLKEKIRERDNRTCQLCNTRENGQKLCVHHIHYDKENCAPDLISLCARCSTKVNFNRDHYENLFMEKLRARGLLC